MWTSSGQRLTIFTAAGLLAAALANGIGCSEKPVEQPQSAGATSGAASSQPDGRTAGAIEQASSISPLPGASSAMGPVQGAIEIGRPYAVGASGHNTNVELTVSELQLATDAGGTSAQSGEQFLIVTTAWKNLMPPKQIQRPKGGGRTGLMGAGEMETVTLETPYLVQNLSDNLYLLIDGRYVAEVSDATPALAEPLPVTGLVIRRHNEQVQGKVAFAIPSTGLQSLTLQFFDFAQGHVTLPLYGKTPSGGERPIAGPHRNQLFDIAVYRTQFAKKIGSSEAPTGEQYLLVECSGASTAAGAATQIDLSQYAFLIEDGVYQSPPLADLPGVPHLLHGLVRFIPEYPRRGVMAFRVPEQPARLELLFAASQMDPLRFVLTPDRAVAVQPAPKATIRDGDNIDVLINSWAWTDRIGDAAPADGSRYLVLDVTMANREAHSGLTVQPQQFSILRSATTIEASAASDRLRHPLAGERTVSAGTRARFEVAYEVPQPASNLRLRYQGFTKVEEMAIR